MKKIILCIIVVLLIFTGCNNNGCKIKYPKNIKPIDWENYNNVYDIFWNYHTENSVTNKKIDQDRGKDIMVYGYIFGISTFHFSLIANKDNSEIQLFISPFDYHYEDDDRYANIDTLLNQIQTKLDTSDLTKKCFIKGKLSNESFPNNDCNWIDPKIIITDINNIYFE